MMSIPNIVQGVMSMMMMTMMMMMMMMTRPACPAALISAVHIPWHLCHTVYTGSEGAVSNSLSSLGNHQGWSLDY
jgi:hypothetical protein